MKTLISIFVFALLVACEEHQEDFSESPLAKNLREQAKRVKKARKMLEEAPAYCQRCPECRGFLRHKVESAEADFRSLWMEHDNLVQGFEDY